MTNDIATATVDNGQFTAGNRGRPVGSKNKSRQLLDAINASDPDALQAIVDKTVQAAREGKVWAITAILDKVFVQKERTVSFELRHIATVADVAAALDDVLQAVANGELTPTEAASIADLIRSYADPVVKTEQARIMMEHKKLEKR